MSQYLNNIPISHYINISIFQCLFQYRNIPIDSFPLKNDLTEHIKTKHAWFLKCAKCGKVFDEEWKLRAHIKNHKEYLCENCEKVFKCE